jgi:peptidoglycan-N-acetylglucosamine deacetylase
VRVALTVDIEQRSRVADPANPGILLDTLAEHGVPAAFFMQGRWAAAYPGTARRVADEGHLIGNHTYHHAPLTMMSDEGIRHTVERAEAVIRERTGAPLKPWFRCPYGDGEDDPRVLRVLDEAGYRNIGWDVDANDWRPGRDADELVTSVIDGCVSFGDGTIVLMHSWPDVTVATLPRVIECLREAGADLVRLDAL